MAFLYRSTLDRRNQGRAGAITSPLSPRSGTDGAVTLSSWTAPTMIFSSASASWVSTDVGRPIRLTNTGGASVCIFMVSTTTVTNGFVVTLGGTGSGTATANSSATPSTTASNVATAINSSLSTYVHAQAIGSYVIVSQAAGGAGAFTGITVAISGTGIGSSVINYTGNTAATTLIGGGAYDDIYIIDSIDSSLVITGITGTFSLGETVNFSGGGSATVAKATSTSPLYIYNTTGTLTGTVTGATSGATATAGALTTFAAVNLRLNHNVSAGGAVASPARFFENFASCNWTIAPTATFTADGSTDIGNYLPGSYILIEADPNGGNNGLWQICNQTSTQVVMLAKNWFYGVTDFVTGVGIANGTTYLVTDDSSNFVASTNIRWSITDRQSVNGADLYEQMHQFLIDAGWQLWHQRGSNSYFTTTTNTNFIFRDNIYKSTGETQSGWNGGNLVFLRLVMGSYSGGRTAGPPVAMSYTSIGISGMLSYDPSAMVSQGAATSYFRGNGKGTTAGNTSTPEPAQLTTNFGGSVSTPSDFYVMSTDLNIAGRGHTPWRVQYINHVMIGDRTEFHFNIENDGIPASGNNGPTPTGMGEWTTMSAGITTYIGQNTNIVQLNAITVTAGTGNYVNTGTFDLSTLGYHVGDNITVRGNSNNPIEYIESGTIGAFTYSIPYTGGSGTATAGGTLTDSTTGATATVAVAQTGATGSINVYNISGTFANTNSLSATGGFAATASGGPTSPYGVITAAALSQQYGSGNSAGGIAETYLGTVGEDPFPWWQFTYNSTQWGSGGASSTMRLNNIAATAGTIGYSTTNFGQTGGTSAMLSALATFLELLPNRKTGRFGISPIHIKYTSNEFRGRTRYLFVTDVGSFTIGKKLLDPINNLVYVVTGPQGTSARLTGTSPGLVVGPIPKAQAGVF